jgi:hypothetical protein
MSKVQVKSKVVSTKERQKVLQSWMDLLDIGLRVNELFDLDGRPCNSFSNIISILSVIALNKWQISLYITPLSWSCGCGESAGCDMVSSKIENNARRLAIRK